MKPIFAGKNQLIFMNMLILLRYLSLGQAGIFIANLKRERYSKYKIQNTFMQV